MASHALPCRLRSLVPACVPGGGPERSCRPALAKRLATVQHIHFLAAAGAADVPRMALKNSALGSTTITSDLLRKLVR